jgi:hypothetical protein
MCTCVCLCLSAGMEEKLLGQVLKRLDSCSPFKTVLACVKIVQESCRPLLTSPFLSLPFPSHHFPLFRTFSDAGFLTKDPSKTRIFSSNHPDPRSGTPAEYMRLQATMWKHLSPTTMQSLEDEGALKAGKFVEEQKIPHDAADLLAVLPAGGHFAK